MDNEKMNKTILLVEDEAIISIITSKSLSRFGYDVIPVNSGEKAVELAFADENINLILMDINLGDGIDGTESARQILSSRDIPIVFHTSHSEREMVEKVRGITRYGYVIKSSGDFVLQSSIEMAFELFEANRKNQKIMTAMTESEEKYRAAFTTSPDAVNINAMDGRYVDINEGFTELTGFTRDDVIGVLSSEINIWSRPGDRVKLIKGLTEDGVVENLESLFRCKDGSLKTALMSARVITIKNKPHILSITRDISERKHWEELLKIKNEELEATNEELNAAMEEMEAANEELIAANEDLQLKDMTIIREKIFTEAMLESIPGLLYVYDEQGNLIRWNKKHETMTGYSADELSHMTLAEFYEGNDAVKVAAAVEDVFKKGYGEVDAQLLIKGGGKLFVHSNGVQLIIDGKSYFTGVGMDITERNRIEEELRNTNNLLSQFISHSPIYAYIKKVTPSRSLVLYASDNYKEMIGIPDSEMIGKDMDDLFPHEFAEKMTADDWAVISKGEVFTLDEELNGRSYITIKYPVIAEDKTLLAGYTIDITERKQAEDKIKKLLAEKEIILREVHHRIKNNMNTINSILALQADNLEDPLAIAALEDAGNRVRSMMVLYDKLYQSAEFKCISTADYIPFLVDEIVSNFPKSKEVKIEKNIDNFVLDIKKLQPLGIIINELLTNTMKYAITGKSEDLIKVSATLSDNHVTFTIQDNGVGMPESVDFVNSPGFGMQLVSMLTEQIGGSIRIERGEGTKFVLEFDV